MDSVQTNNPTDLQKKQTAREFLSALGSGDTKLMSSVITTNVVWTFPGSSLISGNARGIEEVLERASRISKYGVKVQLQHFHFGANDIAATLHNQGRRGALLLDEYLVTVFTFQDNKIATLDTYASDVANIDLFFV